MPLSSLRVLDLSRLLPGPYCSMFFSDFGAEVIKIEEPELGDYVRWNEPKVGENSAVFHSLNRNKKSVTLNLKSEKGKEVFQRLVETADIVLESFRPGVMDRLGLGYEDLKKINPKLIYCAITGYGQNGPYAQFPGHDINYQSYAGLLGLQGHVNGAPVLSAIQIADIGGGSQMATIGILIALQARSQTGEGQFVDISMRDGIISWMQSMYPGYFVNGKVPEKGKLKLGGGLACYGVYETSDGRYFSVGALEEKFWQVFCTEIAAPHLIPKLNEPFEVQQQMKEEIASIIKRKTLKEWMNIFDGKDACVSPVLTMDEVVHDPQVKAREMVVEVEDARYVGFPIKLSNTPGNIRNQAPNLGENNKEIFSELGYSSEEVAAWSKDGIV